MKFKGQQLKDSTLEGRLKLFLKVANQKEIVNGMQWYKLMYEWVESIAANNDIPMYQVFK